MLPDGWKETQPANIVTFFNGFAFKSTDTTDKGIKWIKITNVLPGGISWKECNYLPIDFCKEYSDFLVKKGDIVVALTRPIINNHLKIGRLENEDDLSLLNQRVAKLVPKNGNYLNYIYHLFRSDDFSNKIQKALMGTDPPNLSMSVLKRFLLPIPPLPEQKKIAAILSTWDRAIEGTEKLLANSQQQKKALMQQLLTAKKRLPGFTGEWRNYKLENILNVRKEKSLPSNKTPLFSLTIEGGITSKTDRYNREFLVKNKNEKKYKVVYPRDLVYNPANLRWGAINYSRIPHKVVVSPIYEVLYVNNIERFFPDLIYQYLMSPFQIEKFSSMIEGTLMERKAVKISPFLATKIRIPSEFPEQKAIAAVLSSADEEITALESDLSRLRQEKKALMQQLLTGKRRVRVD